MRNRFIRGLFLLLVLIAAAVFLWTSYSLLGLRFSRGEVHDEYSSFRADPLGCKVLCESLRKLPGVKADRLLRPVDEIENPEDSVLIVTGVRSLDSISNDRRLLNYVLGGGRLAVLFSPEALGRFVKKEEKEEEKKDGEDKASENKDGKKKTKRIKKTEPLPESELKGRWMFSVMSFRVAKDKAALPVKDAEKTYGFEELPFYSEICFETYGEWKLLYQCREKPVVIERKFGRGTFIAAADSTFLSNEALLNKRALKFICYIFADRKNIYFEERIHGVASDHNIFWLGRKYKLGLLLLNLLLAALLFVWKNAMSIREPHADGKRSGSPNASERHAAAGLANLFKRGIPGKELIGSCIFEWKKTSSMRNIPAAEMTSIEAVGKEKQKTVDAYNKIHEIIYGLKARKK